MKKLAKLLKYYQKKERHASIRDRAMHCVAVFIRMDMDRRGGGVQILTTEDVKTYVALGIELGLRAGAAAAAAQRKDIEEGIEGETPDVMNEMVEYTLTGSIAREEEKQPVH